MRVVGSQASIHGNTVHSMKNTQQADPLCPSSTACLLTLPPPLSQTRRVAGANETHCPCIPHMWSLLGQNSRPKGPRRRRPPMFLERDLLMYSFDRITCRLPGPYHPRRLKLARRGTRTLRRMASRSPTGSAVVAPPGHVPTAIRPKKVTNSPKQNATPPVNLFEDGKKDTVEGNHNHWRC